MNISIRQLEYFLALSQTLNFREAAESCFVTQPALSKQIQLLEDSLGIPLFERDKKHVLLTDKGQVMLNRASNILTALSDMEREAQSFKKPFSGKLRIGVIPTIAPYILPTVVPHLSRLYPDLQLSLHEHRTDQLIHKMLHNQLDLLILALNVELEGLCSTPLYDDPFLLATPIGHPLSSKTVIHKKDLKNQEFLLLEDGHCMRDHALEVCEFAQAKEVPDFRASSLSTLIAMVAAGNGITLLPSIAVSDDPHIKKSLEILPLTKNTPTRTIGFAWRPTTHRSEEFHQLVKIFRDYAPPGAKL
ncbi:MAG: LysR substrate-binding domain-containing protein [Verrucomicrobiales bacterium]|nr:LysR substrate-binding domain-containing protein [Verrucomicrobiales bacterium]